MKTEKEEGLMRCPGCGGRDVRPSYPHGLWDAMMSVIRRFPFRCRGCAVRFYRYVPKEQLAEDGIKVRAASGAFRD